MTLEFRCRDVGVVCSGKVSAATEDELVAKIAKHAADSHDIPELDATLVDYAKTAVNKK